MTSNYLAGIFDVPRLTPQSIVLAGGDALEPLAGHAILICASRAYERVVEPLATCAYPADLARRVADDQRVRAEIACDDRTGADQRVFPDDAGLGGRAADDSGVRADAGATADAGRAVF